MGGVIELSTIGTGWSATTPGLTDRTTLPLPPLAGDELLAAAADREGGSPRPDERPPPGLPATAALAADLRRRLRDPGFVTVRGFPVDAPEELVERAYWILGLHLGQPVSQSRRGDLVGRVEDRGSDIGDPTRRGYESAAALPFHVDRTDVIGLLCVRPAAEGGRSRLASSITVHDVLARERPDLLAALYEPLPHDRRGEEAPGELPWAELPVFCRAGDSVAARYVRRFVEGSQRHAQAPRLTAGQVEALDAVDEILAREDVHLDLDLAPGDLQLINNFTILHARTAFRDVAGGGGRLLLRLWLSWDASPPLPASFAPLYGATDPGVVRGGVWPLPGAHPWIGTPVRPV